MCPRFLVQRTGNHGALQAFYQKNLHIAQLALGGVSARRRITRLNSCESGGSPAPKAPSIFACRLPCHGPRCEAGQVLEGASALMRLLPRRAECVFCPESACTRRNLRYFHFCRPRWTPSRTVLGAKVAFRRPYFRRAERSLEAETWLFDCSMCRFPRRWPLLRSWSPARFKREFSRPGSR